MKFLDLNGLTAFWTGAKSWFSENYYNKKQGVSIDTELIKVGQDTDIVSVTPVNITLQDATTKDISKIYADHIESPSFIKNDGTKSQVLLANGGVAELLTEDGKIKTDKLNIDTTLFSIVTELPISNIVKNRIYLVKLKTTGTQNIYTEYIYTGDTSSTYDVNKWEKLGEYTSDIDLSKYSKIETTVSKVESGVDENKSNVILKISLANGNSSTITLPNVSETTPGVMSSTDKKSLDLILEQYPLTITEFTASPNLIEVGETKDVTFTWDYENSGFNPVTKQELTDAAGTKHTVNVGTESYKQSNLAGATTATTKSATLKLNDTIVKTVTITYHYPTYIGVVASNATINETSVKALTKSVEWGKGKTATLTQNDQKIVYAYPASYGNLSSIKDGNGFEGINGYTKQTLTVGGQSYNVYVQNIAATSSSKYTFA